MNTEREILNNPIFRICWTLFIAALLLESPWSRYNRQYSRL